MGVGELGGKGGEKYPVILVQNLYRIVNLGIVSCCFYPTLSFESAVSGRVCCI